MALAPVGDPQRPLQLAIRSTRIMGIVLVGFGLLTLSMVYLMTSRGLPSRFFFAIAVGAYLLPGIVLVILAIFLGQRQPWAVIATMVVAVVQMLIALITLLGSLAQFNFIVIVISALWIAAMIQLLFHLSKSFAAIRAYSVPTQRGFEPLQPGTFPPPPMQ